MKDTLIKFCNSIGIEYIGVAPATPYEDFGEVWKKQIEKGYITGFEEKEFQRRVDPALTMADAGSVIVCLFPYYVGLPKETNLSKYVFSDDYHIIIKEKLETIGEFLRKKIEGFNYKAYVDAGPFSERYLAYKAGLGFRGINGHIINDKYGSYFFIGYILNNYPFEIDKPDERACKKCYKCMESCPGQCILGDFTINPLKCKSYLTQKKGELSPDEAEIIKKTPLIWGCDICQDVCPHNQNAEKTNIYEFKINLIYNVNCNEIKEMSHREFEKKYGDRAFSWRGKKILKRNCQL